MAKDKEFDGGNPADVKEKQSKAKLLEARKAEGLKHILSNADSRLWLYHQLEEAGPFRDPFTGNSQTFYQCGAQAWAKRLIAQLLERHLDDYVRMMKENAEASHG